jgi:NAD(P)-dependent dehydrogenase (short-subunit alcohol dehydrogenase family)
MTQRQQRWSAADVGDQEGRTFVVTGANSGIGLEAVRVLAARGATVVMACRNLQKAEAARAEVLRATPTARLSLVPLDLSDLDSVRACAARVLAEHETIDVLINNAGIMAIPRAETRQGFEMQLGTNHLGHFALTGLLIGRLRESGRRVVTISSQAHRGGRIHFDDLQLARGYGEWKAYGQSKLANLLFAFELDRRLRASGAPLLSVAAHPGYSDTDLQHVGPRVKGNRTLEWMMGTFNKIAAQPAADGALPTLRAAVDPAVQGGDYYGPSGPFEMGGPPVKVRANAQANDPDAAARLWAISEELTGVRYGL